MPESAPNSEISVLLPGSPQRTILPAGWTTAGEKVPLVLIGPEEDLRITVLSAPLAATMRDTALQAWRKIDEGFSYPILQEIEMPSTGGWDKVAQIVYNIPATGGKMVAAVLRTLQGHAYIALIQGSKAAAGRRMAQFAEILETWKPAGLAPPNLSSKPAKPWGHQESGELDSFIREAIEELLIPGVSIAIVQTGRIVYTQGYGVRKADGAEPVTPSTGFMVGSITKPLTTLMMARLIDQGRFAWSTPVRQLLPDFELADTAVTRKLEMRHTVCACTGMPRRDVDFLFRFKGISPEQRLAEMRTMRPTTGFGEVFQYSNLLVAAGGYAAARAYAPDVPLESAYRQAMRDLVFDPLGMRHSGLREEDAISAEPAAPNAIDFDTRTVPIDPELEQFAAAVAPAGAVWSTALDMAEYLLLELAGGQTRTGQRLVSEEILQSRWHGGIKITAKQGYGLGLMHSEESGLEIIGHGGNTLGFTSDMWFIPAHNLGVVALTNLRAANTFLAALRFRIVELIFGGEKKAESIVAAAARAQRDFAEKVRERTAIDPVSTAWLEKYIGEYDSEELGAASILKTDVGYRADFESWGSALGVEVQQSGERLIALTDAPWSGAFRLQTLDGGDLLLDAGQDKYRFRRR